MAERHEQQMKREREDAVLCYQRCKFPRLAASERNPGAKSASHEATLLFAVLRNVPQLVPRCNNTYISMHGTSIICWEYAPYYPTSTADSSLQIVEYRLTHECLSQTFNTTDHSAHSLEWVRVRLEKLRGHPGASDLHLRAANTFNNIERVYSRAIAFSNRRCSVPLESVLPTSQVCTVSSSIRTAFI